MTLAQQRRTIAVSSMVVFGVGIISRIQKGQSWTDPTAARFFIGVGLAFTIVSVFNDLGLEIGAGFAILIMLTALMVEGNSVFGFLIHRSRKIKDTKNTIGTPGGRKNPRTTPARKKNAEAFLSYQATHPNAVYNPQRNY